MPSFDPAALTREVVRALALAGRRGVLLSGWGALAGVELPKTVFALEAAPHDWLFPRMAAVVHHGGAGTTSAALRAGVPSLVAPFMADQSFWGGRIAALGAGPAPFPRRGLTAQNFSEALRDLVENPRYRAGAERVAAALAAEDGVGRAVAALPF
jgi:sterol 3beta-glucosyltransferase